MKKIFKKSLMLASLFGIAFALSGCMSGPKHHKQQPGWQQQNTETFVFVETVEEMDVNKVMAKMYTHSSKGGDVEMGTVSFTPAKGGLKMTVNLSYLRPNVMYNVKVYKCNKCKNGMCCDKPCAANSQLPMISVQSNQPLQTSYMIEGVSLNQLMNSKIYLERDGGYKAAWGMLKPDMTM